MTFVSWGAYDTMTVVTWEQITDDICYVETGDTTSVGMWEHVTR